MRARFHALVEGLEIGRGPPRISKIAVFPDLDEIIVRLGAMCGYGGSGDEHHMPEYTP
jgi:hypothetical protein